MKLTDKTRPAGVRALFAVKNPGVKTTLFPCFYPQAYIHL